MTAQAVRESSRARMCRIALERRDKLREPVKSKMQGREEPLVSGQFFVTSLWPFGTSSTIFSSCSEPLRTDDVLNRFFVEDADAVAARRNVNAAACTTRGWLPKEVAHAEKVGGGLSAGPKHAPACLPRTDITLCCSAE